MDTIGMNQKPKVWVKIFYESFMPYHLKLLEIQ